MSDRDQMSSIAFGPDRRLGPGRSMKESPCIGTGHLRETFAQGRFADPVDSCRALFHFTRPCRCCWQHLGALVADPCEIDLEALQRRALENPREPAVALALGRLVLVARQPSVAAALPPTHRHLLRKTTWNRSFDFWWLLIKEDRNLAVAVLTEDARSPAGVNWTFDAELWLLMLAYQADQFRLAGHPRLAEVLVARLLPQADRCRPEIRATIHEIQADITWASTRDPSPVLKHLALADELLKKVRIPGRRDETRARMALARLRQIEACAVADLREKYHVIS